MNTYMLTTLLAQNNYYSVLTSGVDPVAVYKSVDACPKWAQPECNPDTAWLGCDGVLDAYGMCRNVWYSAEHKSSYTLLKRGKTNIDQTIDVMHQIVETGVLGDAATAFKYLFENTAICSLKNVFPDDSNPQYDAQAGGFYYNVQNFLDVAPSSRGISHTTYFLPIAPVPTAGQGFVDLSKDARYVDKITYSVDRLYGTDASGTLEQYCISQLSLSVANYWAGRKADNWPKRTPK